MFSRRHRSSSPENNEGTNPTVEVPALALPSDGSEYVMVKVGAGHTVEAVVKVLGVLPQIIAAFQSKTVWGKVFSLLAVAGQIGVIPTE